MARGARRFAVSLIFAVAAMLALAPAIARAEVKRYAFLIGANHGAPHEVPLRYAESDVNAVADLLTEFGGFASERVVRLIAPSAPRVRQALIQQILGMQQDLRKSGGEAVLFVFYSGHGDAQNLHLGGTELPTDELSNLVRLSQAKLKVLLVDACRSGALTRVKGGRTVAPFQIGVEDLLRNEGYAIITSSAAGEDAQESEALRGSVFTHHFLSALRGLGDVNRDRLVTLGEAYTYAAEQTLKASLDTVAGSQHATFEYDLRGRADPVLADLRSRGERAELVLTTPGDYLLMAADSGALLFEAAVKTAQTPLQLSAGKYRIRARTSHNVYETEVALESATSRTLGTGDMKPIPLAQVVRKGETAAELANGPTVGGVVHGAPADGFSPMMGAQIGWSFELPRLSLMPRLGIASGHALSTPDAIRSNTFREITAELTALYVFDLDRLSIAPLVSIGWGFFQQTIEQDSNCLAGTCEVVSHPQGLITSVGGWAAYPLGHGFAFEASLELANFYLRKQQDTTALDTSAARAGTLTYRGGLGLGYRY